MKLEEKLVAMRKEKGLSQLKLAEEMNVSRQAISRWERGTAVPSTENLKYLGRLYDVPLDYLLHEDAPEPVLHGRDKVTDGREKKRKQAVILIAIVVIAAFLCAVFLRDEPRKSVPMNEIERSEVETDNTNDFELDF